MCDIDNCENYATTIIESGHFLCSDHVVHGAKIICKICKVPMHSRTDHRAVDGLRHQLDYPRGE